MNKLEELITALTDADEQNTGCVIEARDVTLLLIELERMRDYREDYKRTVNESCSPDELHCSCVPALRAEVERMKGYLSRMDICPICEKETPQMLISQNWHCPVCDNEYQHRRIVRWEDEKA